MPPESLCSPIFRLRATGLTYSEMRTRGGKQSSRDMAISRFLLDRVTTTAGHHPDSNIFLDDVTVSRRHAEFRCVSGEFQIVDVGSLNGTYVNREPVDSAVLANGDEVQIGKFRLVFLTGPTTGDTESVTR